MPWCRRKVLAGPARPARCKEGKAVGRVAPLSLQASTAGTGDYLMEVPDKALATETATVLDCMLGDALVLLSDSSDKEQAIAASADQMLGHLTVVSAA